MPVDATVAQNAFLDNTLGPDRGVGTPASLDFGLFAGDPRDGGVEVTGSGYARVAWSSDDWGPAADGETTTTADLQAPDPTGAYPDTVTHWAAFDGTDRWFSGPLETPLDVTSAGDGPLFRPVVAFVDSE